MNTSASVYAADPLNLANELKTVITKVESLHFDVMDGHFSATYGLNLELFSRLKSFTDKPIDVHLMISNPEVWADYFARKGARWIAFHPESCHDPVSVINTIKTQGSRAYLAFSPNIQPDDYQSLMSIADGVLLLTAPAGGGELDTTAFEKIKQIPSMLPMAFDGKITPDLLSQLRGKTGDLAIMGKALFNNPD